MKIINQILVEMLVGHSLVFVLNINMLYQVVVRISILARDVDFISNATLPY